MISRNNLHTPNFKEMVPWKLGRWRHYLSSVSLLPAEDGLGVFVDTGQMTLAHVQKSYSGIQVKHWAQLPVEIDNLEREAAGLQHMMTEWKLESSPVGLAVATSMGFCRQAVLPPAAAENLAQVVAYELDRFLPLPAEKLYYDFQLLEKTANELRIMLMALPLGLVNRCLDLLVNSGLQPVSVELEPVAAANAFSRLGGDLTGSWLLLHLEPGAFELAQIREQKVYAFNRDRQIPPQEYLETIHSHLGQMLKVDPKVGVLYLYGAEETEFHPDWLQQYPLDRISASHFAITGLSPDVSLDNGLPALGAALSCQGKGLLKMNLLPPAQRGTKNLRRLSLTAPLLLVFLLLFTVWLGSAFIHERVMLYQVNRQIARITPEVQEVERQLQESRTLAQQMQNFRKIGQTPDKMRILKDLTQLIPENTWLLNLRINKQNLEISGMSGSASELIPLLEKSGWLIKTEFASPIVTDANKTEHFKIKAEIKPLEPGS